MPLNLVKPLKGNPRRVRGFQAHLAAGPVGAWHGIDDAVVVGTELVAMDDGTIGNVQKIATGGGWNFRLNFSKYPGWFGWYAHCSALPTTGQKVLRGQVIGKSGNTGGSTGPHLHWSLLQNGLPKDPDLTSVAVYSESGGDFMVDKDLLYWLYRDVLGRANGTGTDAGALGYIGKPVKDVYVTLYNSQEAQRYRANKEAELVDLRAKVATIATLENKVNSLTNDIGALNVQFKDVNEALISLQSDLTIKDKELVDLRKKLEEYELQKPLPLTIQQMLEAVIKWAKEVITK